MSQCSSSVQQLQSMGDCPVAVVSISGPSRQGKSYTLNRLVSAAGGFPVSPGMKPCTHGIWMWPQALEVQGKPHKVLFLDSEGIATKEQSSQAGSTLVALAGVASSLMIANQFNNLNEDSLGHLSVAAAVMRGLFRSTTGSVAAGCQPPCSPPELLFLLRDFNLHSEKTASEYLEQELQDLDPEEALDEAAIWAKNGMRAQIRAAFPHRSAMFLKHPGPPDAVDVERLPDSALNPGFVQGLSELASMVFERAAPKTFRGVTLTEPLLVSLLGGAVAAANKSEGKINIGSMWSAMLDAELARAAAAARAAYEEGTKQLAACSSAEQAEQMHKDALAAAKSAFTASIEFADAASQAGAWAAAEYQLAQAFEGLLERIKRQEAERQLAYSVLLAEAKAAGPEALDRPGLLKLLEGNCSEEHAVAMAQIRAGSAQSTFDTRLKAWTGKAPQQQQAALAAAQSELAAAADALRDAAVQHARASAAADEQERLQQERDLDSLQQAAVSDAVAEYKQEMEDLFHTSSDVEHVHSQHWDVLDELKAALPDSGLPEHRVASAYMEMMHRCNELRDAGITIIEQRKEAEQQRKQAEACSKLAGAERAAFAAFKSALGDRVPTGFTDEQAARWSCEACQSEACHALWNAAFDLGLLTSPERHEKHRQHEKHLQDSMDSWCNQVLATVKANAEQAAQLEALRQEAEEAARRNAATAAEVEALQKKADEAAAEAVRRAQEQAAEIERLRVQAVQPPPPPPQHDRAVSIDLRDLIGLFRPFQQQMAAPQALQLPWGGSCIVEEPDDFGFGAGYFDEPRARYGRSSSRSAGAGRRIGITAKGKDCSNCLKGYNCAANHASYR